MMKHALILFCLILSALCPAAYLGSWAIDDYLTITATTHSPTTGAAAAASAITMRIYEDDTDTEIVSDQNMTAFDSVTGLYKYKPQLTAAAGFEAGKCYTVLISATVDTVTAITTHTFQIQSKTTAITVSDKTGYALAADQAVNVTKIAGAAVNTASAQIGVNVVSQDNIDFGALQKASLNAATPASVVGAVGSVTGAVGSVTGNVGGNVVGSVASVTAGVTLEDGAITAAKIAASALNGKGDWNTTTPPAVGAIADAVWDEAIADHTTATTFGGKNQKAVPSETVGDYKATGFSTHSAADVLSTAISGTDAGDLGYVIDLLYTLLTTGEGAKVGSIAANAITASAIHADAVAELQSGLSNHSAADVWAVATRALTDKANFTLHADYDAAKTSAQAAVCTDARLAELDAANLPASVDWLVNVTEGDTYIDTTVTPWQMVIYKKGDALTEYIRKNLYDVTGTALTSVDTVVGKQTEPE